MSDLKGPRGVLSYEERILLREAVSRIQVEKEKHARRLYMVTAYGEQMNLGGGARPWQEQNRGGYVASSDRHAN